MAMPTDEQIAKMLRALESYWLPDYAEEFAWFEALVAEAREAARLRAENERRAAKYVDAERRATEFARRADRAEQGD